MADILEAPIDNHVHVSHSQDFISLYKTSTPIGFEKYYYKYSFYASDYCHLFTPFTINSTFH